jgi:hypothetical protein
MWNGCACAQGINYPTCFYKEWVPMWNGTWLERKKKVLVPSDSVISKFCCYEIRAKRWNRFPVEFRSCQAESSCGTGRTDLTVCLQNVCEDASCFDYATLRSKSRVFSTTFRIWWFSFPSYIKNIIYYLTTNDDLMIYAIIWWFTLQNVLDTV